MQEYFKVKHSYNGGDLIALLPGIQYFSKKTGKKAIIYQRLDFPAYYYDGAAISVKNEEGHSVSFNRYMFDMIKPLLIEQDYIQDFVEWKGEEVDFDMDTTRDSRLIPMPAGHIHHWAWAIYPELECDLSQQWINSVKGFYGEEHYFWVKYRHKIIINRTERYQNPYITYYFLKDYQDDVVFAGTMDEYKAFCKQWDLKINYLDIKNFLELAQAIKSSKGFIGNQSFCWHLADAQKKIRVLELCPQFPNTFPTGANGYAFYHQKSLEYHFHKLLNQKINL